MPQFRLRQGHSRDDNDDKPVLDSRTLIHYNAAPFPVPSAIIQWTEDL